MKFYIFASDTEVINANPRTSKYQASLYEDAMTTFDYWCNEYTYAHMYLIADFECKHSKMLGYESWEHLKDNIIVPFLIVKEFHYDNNNEKCNATGYNGKIDVEKTIRKDTIVIESSGFAHIFNNNQEALDKFINCYIDNKIPASMILLFNLNENGKNNMYRRKIASSIEVVRAKPITLGKIKLLSNLNISKYNIPKYTAYNFKFEPNTSEMIAAGGL